MILWHKYLLIFESGRPRIWPKFLNVLLHAYTWLLPRHSVSWPLWCCHYRSMKVCSMHATESSSLGNITNVNCAVIAEWWWVSLQQSLSSVSLAAFVGADMKGRVGTTWSYSTMLPGTVSLFSTKISNKCWTRRTCMTNCRCCLYNLSAWLVLRLRHGWRLLDWLGEEVQATWLMTMLATYQNRNVDISAQLGSQIRTSHAFGVRIIAVRCSKFRLSLYITSMGPVAVLRSCPNNCACPNYWLATIVRCLFCWPAEHTTCMLSSLGVFCDLREK